MKVRFRNKLESFVRCEKQHWPDCGGPSNTFSHPTPSKAAKPPKPIPFRVRPKLRQQPTSKNLGSFREGCSKFQRGGLGQAPSQDQPAVSGAGLTPEVRTHTHHTGTKKMAGMGGGGPDKVGGPGPPAVGPSWGYPLENASHLLAQGLGVTLL